MKCLTFAQQSVGTACKKQFTLLVYLSALRNVPKSGFSPDYPTDDFKVLP